MTRLLLGALVLVLVACSGASQPSAPPSAVPSPAGRAVATAEEAAARVAEVNPGLAGIEKRDPEMIGGCCFWEATPTAEGFTVMFEVGWGDCPSGCINRHRWTYAVSRDGSTRLLDESGEPVPSGVPGSDADSITGSGSGGGILPGESGIQGTALAGPTCAVVQVGDASCDDRPVAGATVIFLNAAGAEVARVTTGLDGRYAATLPPGDYTVEPQPVDGLLGTAAAVSMTVDDGFQTVDLGYDTGIR